MTHREVVDAIYRADGRCGPLAGFGCADCPFQGEDCGGSDHIVAMCRDYLGEHGESPEGKPVDHFEVGKWYKIIPSDAVVDWWLNQWSDGDPRRVIMVDGGHVQFEGMKDASGVISWIVPTAKHYREVPAPGTIGREAKPGIVEITIRDMDVSKIWGALSSVLVSGVSSKASRRRDILSRLSID